MIRLPWAWTWVLPNPNENSPPLTHKHVIPRGEVAGAQTVAEFPKAKYVAYTATNRGTDTRCSGAKGSW